VVVLVTTTPILIGRCTIAEITYTGTGDLHIAASLNQHLHHGLSDQTDLRGTITNMGDVSGKGSLASKIAGVTFDDAMAAANADEVTSPTATSLTTSAATVTVARQAIVREVTDLYGIAGSAPGLKLLADSLAGSAKMRFTDMLCALFTSVASVVGVTGSTMSVDTFSDGLAQLEIEGNGGKIHAVLAPKAFTQFQDDLRSEGGSAQWQPATEAMLSNDPNGVGYGYKGDWRGVSVWSVDSVTDDATDFASCMYQEQAFSYMEGVPNEETQAAAPGSYMALTPEGAPIFVEFERDAKKATTTVVGNYYVGVVEQEDLRAVRLRSGV
jgi:hypothetical protein